MNVIFIYRLYCYIGIVEIILYRQLKLKKILLRVVKALQSEHLNYM